MVDAIANSFLNASCLAVSGLITYTMEKHAASEMKIRTCDYCNSQASSIFRKLVQQWKPMYFFSAGVEELDT